MAEGPRIYRMDEEHPADALANALVAELKPLVEEVRALRQPPPPRNGSKSVTIPAWAVWIITLTLPFLVAGSVALAAAVNANGSRLDRIEAQQTQHDADVDRRLDRLERLHDGRNDG